MAKIVDKSYYDELKNKLKEELTLAEVVYILEHKNKELEQRVRELEINVKILYGLSKKYKK